MGSGQKRVHLGRGPITYPTGQLFSSRKTLETGTSFYVGTKSLVELVLSINLGTNWYCSACGLGNTLNTQSCKIFLSITAILLAFLRAKIFFIFGYEKCSLRLIHE